jgi:5-methylcytosine-specific restriction endonuclease McrA
MLDIKCKSKIFLLIEKGLCSAQIALKTHTTYQTILSRVKNWNKKYYHKLLNNGKLNVINAGKSRLKDGRSIVWKYKKSYCQFCKSDKNLDTHHLIPAHYIKKENGLTYMTVGNHNENNIITLCRSCHNKIHFKMGRKIWNKGGGNVK